jgi:GntR family transcriptional regulator
VAPGVLVQYQGVQASKQPQSKRLCHFISTVLYYGVRMALPQFDPRVNRDLDVPVGAQLAWRLREAMRSGVVSPGERLPSVRELAAAAGVNVNTVRAVYQRLENEGLLRSEQGRGTFAAAPGADASTRQELRRQIAALEAALVRRPRSPGAEAPPGAPARSGGRLQTTAELRDIRDGLLERLQQIDAERTDLLRRLAELERAEGLERVEAPETEAAEADRHSSASLRGARVRWVGA